MASNDDPDMRVPHDLSVRAGQVTDSTRLTILVSPKLLGNTMQNADTTYNAYTSIGGESQ